MAKARKGDYLSCEVCGLGLVVDKGCGCEVTEVVCCSKPMVKVKKTKKPASKEKPAKAKTAVKATAKKAAPKAKPAAKAAAKKATAKAKPAAKAAAKKTAATKK